jgi:hypothetical protein
MSGSGYGSRKKAILAAQDALRARFGADIRIEPAPPPSAFPRIFRVLDQKGNELRSFRVFKMGVGLQEWAWQESAPDRPSSGANAIPMLLDQRFEADGNVKPQA